MWLVFDFLYFCMLIFGSLVALTGSSWFIIWLGLEVNMMFFIPFIGVKSKMSCEAVFKYFLLQVTASLFLFLMGVLGMYSGFSYFFGGVFSVSGILFIVLAVKLGASPFHLWFPLVMEGLSWPGFFLLMTWQSATPLVLICLVEVSNVLVLLVGAMSVLVGSLGGLNQMLIKSIFAYSSISHVGWMCVIINLVEFDGLVYYIMYVLVSGAVVSCFLFSYYLYVGQVYFLSSKGFWWAGGFYLGLFSLGGLPPLSGFIMSWLGLIVFLKWGYYMFSLLALVFGVGSLYYYLRLGYGGMLMGEVSGMWGDSLLSGWVICFILNFISVLFLPLLIGWVF